MLFYFLAQPLSRAVRRELVHHCYVHCDLTSGSLSTSTWHYYCVILAMHEIESGHSGHIACGAHREAGKCPCCCGFGTVDNRLHHWSQWCKINITSIIISETSDFHISECKTQPPFCTPFSNMTGPVWMSCSGAGSKCCTACGGYYMVSHIQIYGFLPEQGKMKRKEKLFQLSE